MTTTARAWLAIAHGGGRWTITELRQKLPNDHAGTINSIMENLANSGCVAVYEPDATSAWHRYGVTHRCMVPRGITAWEVVEAMGMRLKAGVEEDAAIRGMTVGAILACMAQPERRAA